MCDNTTSQNMAKSSERNEQKKHDHEKKPTNPMPLVPKQEDSIISLASVILPFGFGSDFHRSHKNAKPTKADNTLLDVFRELSEATLLTFSSD